MGVFHPTGKLSFHVSQLSQLSQENFEWQFYTKPYPDGFRLGQGEAYLRRDYDVKHLVNAVEETFTADARNYRKQPFRRGEIVRLASRFVFPVRTKVHYGYRKPDATKLRYKAAILAPRSKIRELHSDGRRRLRRRQLDRLP